MKPKSQFPIGAAVTPDDLDFDLHSTLHRLRPAEPVSWLPTLNAWLVTDYQLTVDVMRDAKTFTVDHPGFSTGQVIGQSMLSLDGDAQYRHRHPFEAPFRKRAVLDRFRQPVADVVERLIDRFEVDGRAELRRAFAGPVAVEAMVTALGLQKTSVTDVLGWYDAIVDAVTRVTAGEPVSDAGKAGFEALKTSLLPSLKADPASSLLAAAAGAAGGLSDDQIISNAAVLLFGGIETTEGMIANALFHLLSTPAVYAEVLNDRSLMPNVIEESLRMEPAASVVDRYTTMPVELGGVAIPEGALVRVSLAGANRDPERFDEPDRFNPHRPDLKSHVTFAQGPHVCLGLHLARLETELALNRLLDRLPHLRFAGDRTDARPRGLVFRKPNRLDVAWGS